MPEATVIKLSIQRMVCTGCGAEANASCNCGKPYVPKAVRAAEALKENPEKSDRAIAADIGVAPNTVKTARDQLRSTAQLGDGPRVGQDGRVRQARKEVSAAEREERERTERKQARREQERLEHYPDVIHCMCERVRLVSIPADDDMGLEIPPGLTAETAAELLPDIETAIENLKRLEAKLAEIADGGNSARRVH